MAEALAPDNPPLKVVFFLISNTKRFLKNTRKSYGIHVSWICCQQIRFIDNTDPAGIDHQIAQLGDELASTLVIVISKVGLCLTSHFAARFHHRSSLAGAVYNGSCWCDTAEWRHS